MIIDDERNTNNILSRFAIQEYRNEMVFKSQGARLTMNNYT